MANELKPGEPKTQTKSPAKRWAANLAVFTCALALGALFSELLIRLTIDDRLAI